MILDKLMEGRYETTVAWCNDMELVFRNAIQFAGPDGIYGHVARILEARFQRMAIGYEASDTASWSQLVHMQIREFSAKCVQSGSYSLDPFVAEMPRRMLLAEPPALGQLQPMVDILERAIKVDEYRGEIRWIIAKMEERIPETIELTTLKPDTQAALAAWASAHQLDLRGAPT
jgi:hypothetical protein